jgi:hypothetical protein
MKISTFRVAAVAVLSLSVVNLGFVSSARAAIVDTGALVTTTRDANLATIRAQLNRADVKQHLEGMGVDVASVDARVANLSDLELQKMATDMQNAPAGGGALVIIGVVFLVLIVLEFVGVIDIFKRR